MRYSPLEKSLFQQNREKLKKKLKSGSIAILNSNDLLPTNADGTMPFRQNNDLFYLSGIDQEETILLIFPDAKDEINKEILFIKETNEHIAIWEGKKYTREEASKISGIEKVVWISQFDSIFETLIPECQHIYLNSNEHNRAVKLVETRDDRFVKWCMSKYPLYQYERLAPFMHQLRCIKSNDELELMQKACDITEKAFRRALKFTRPGVYEYEVEAEYTHEFLRNGSRGHAYEPIVASGANACILHYVENNKVCKDGDLLLIDAGCEYYNYASDLTRVIPVNGKFSQRQRDVYNSVLKVMRAATQLLRPGNTMVEYNKTVVEIIERELIGLGLINLDELKRQNPKNPLYRKYFMHGVSHALGLDVHDVYDKSPFAEGMVFTVEPGIYIREEGIGIRLENNILITENAPFDLMSNIPVEIEEIEEIMLTKK